VKVAPRLSPLRRAQRYFLPGMVLGVMAALSVGGWVMLQRQLETPESAWREFAPPDGGCRLKMPGNPEAKPAAAHGSSLVNVHKYTVLRELEDKGFFLTIAERPADAKPKPRFDDIYMAERDYMLRAAKAALKEEADVSSEGCTGREFQGKVVGGGTLIGRIYLAGDRVYILLAGGPRLEPGKGDAARFFDSFRIDPAR